ncbi:MAG TPA: glycosyltransferase, partial [Desulfobaccales bacterium]
MEPKTQGKKMNLAPIALFVYNRPWHTRQTVESLQQNDPARDSDLFIFADGPKNPGLDPAVLQVREYIRGITGFKSVTLIEREQNLGLAQSLIEGVTRVCGNRGRVIVLEDDMVLSPYFLAYMNQGLDEYAQENRVISIHGYIFPHKGPLPETFFLRGADCWGWATWQRGWSLFEPDGAKLLADLRRRRLTRAFDFNGAYGYTAMLHKQ